ncbi:MAG: bis(5'-nucleosyl)-tetraphosphatase (symmetrical) YqeK [Elusimicrobiota bacterium]|jgi:nicotinate-nucleotide adenylyltransferase|nr:bis(5'-nucleosyl)-tetraphosphatase (symmetrical) YqeK [Elusimicrobiota bacterium]
MKILIYGGSFDPAHKGHFELLKAAFSQIKPDSAYVFTAYQSPFKRKSPVSFETRRQMAAETLREISPKIIFDDFENKVKRIVYAREHINYARKLHPNAKIYLLVGTDCLNDIPKWKNPKYIFDNAVIVAGSRKGFEFTEKTFDFILLKGSFPEICSTQIRFDIFCNGTIPSNIPARTADLIRKKQLYGLNIHKWLCANLKPKRYEHTKFVAREALKFAQIYKADVDAAIIAALLHDAGKSMNAGGLIKYSLKHKIKVNNFKDICKRAPALLHGAVSAHIARILFKVKDGNILSAIKKHTLGAADMNDLEKILFIADMTSQDRLYNEVAFARAQAMKSLDLGLSAAMARKLIFTIETGKWLAPDGLKSWNTLISKNK